MLTIVELLALETVPRYGCTRPPCRARTWWCGPLSHGRSCSTVPVTNVDRIHQVPGLILQGDPPWVPESMEPPESGILREAVNWCFVFFQVTGWPCGGSDADRSTKEQDGKGLDGVYIPLPIPSMKLGGPPIKRFHTYGNMNPQGDEFIIVILCLRICKS